MEPIRFDISCHGRMYLMHSDCESCLIATMAQFALYGCGPWATMGAFYFTYLRSFSQLLVSSALSSNIDANAKTLFTSHTDYLLLISYARVALRKEWLNEPTMLRRSINGTFGGLCFLF